MKRVESRVPGAYTRIRLDEYLAEWLPFALQEHFSRTQIRALISSGSVYVNRHRNQTASAPVYAGSFIEVYFNPDKMNRPKKIDPQIRLKTDEILFEDEWLIVVNKPCGLPTQPTLDPLRPNLFELVKKFLEDRDRLAQPYVGLHHRLDKDTSGMVLFTKKEAINAGIAELFSQRKISKTYHCLVWKSPSAPTLGAKHRFEIKNYLGKISPKGAHSKYGEVKAGGDFAHTEFQVLDHFRDCDWLEAKPQTGRTHQIRVHCAEYGIPILGDPTYFPQGLAPFIVVPRLMLHAHQLDFIHPKTLQPIHLESPLPQDFVHTLGSLKK